ncbi:uncharacterized protein LOC129964269 [Argiope bruennichi]|uniref:uncharacterized protein LOC129964269 n=1 Tax=Argiope bruennichi TaxID=94029 RepID=UPI0024953589|nr:uncharacterized protein LOC129964269 [Argiope bruennichi]
MYKLQIVFVLACFYAVSQSAPISSEEGKALIQEQAQHNYNQHQETLQNRDYSFSSLVNPKYDANGFTFDNKDKSHRDRGYGFEKAYAYSRETAFFDFDDDKGILNARDLVEKLGKEEKNKAHDLLKDVPK